MDIPLDIPYKLSYYCMFLLYKLTLSFYSIHSRVYSLKNCFYPQPKPHCKTGSHPSHGYYLTTDKWHFNDDLTSLLSQTSFFLSALTKQFFICFSFLWFCFSVLFVCSCRFSLENDGSFMRVDMSWYRGYSSRSIWRSSGRESFKYLWKTWLWYFSWLYWGVPSCW